MRNKSYTIKYKKLTIRSRTSRKLLSSFKLKSNTRKVVLLFLCTFIYILDAYSALNKAYEMNKSTLEQMKLKDSMVKRHVNMQDSEISKLKQKIFDQEKQIKALREEVQVYIFMKN